MKERIEEEKRRMKVYFRRLAPHAVEEKSVRI